MSNYGDLIDVADKDSKFSNIVITGDENDASCTIHKQKGTLLNLKSSLLGKKFRVDRNRGNDILEIFFSCQDIVYYQFVREVKTANKEMYFGILLRLWDAVRKKHREQ